MNAPEQHKMPAGDCHEVVVNGKALAVPARSIALIRAIPRRHRKKIIKDNRVRIKDVFPPFTNPARFMKGPLAGLKGGVLRNLYLPVMVPVGSGLTEYTDELASLMVVIYDGWWSGVILCSEATRSPVVMSAYTRGPSGDVVGTAERADNRGRCLVLDVEKFLRREGFLVVA